MNLRFKFFSAALLLVLASATPLDDYVRKPDDHYRWELLDVTLDGRELHSDLTGYVLNMTSQKWLNETVVDQSVWTHSLAVIVPKHIRYPDACFFYIGGRGSTHVPRGWNEVELSQTAEIAKRVGIVGAMLFAVPNQAIGFADEDFKKRRSEDSLIAKTWRLFIDNPGWNEVLVRLPMVKAVVRGMDAVEEFMQQKFGANITRFGLAGASKRGWTTWLAAALENRRVFAFIPMVESLINMEVNLHHYYRSYGGWPIAFDSYAKENVVAILGTAPEKMRKLIAIEDPYVYRERLTMPGMQYSGSNDEFFMIDDSHFYFQDLPGEKHIFFPKNSEHGRETSLKQIASVQSTFIYQVLAGIKRPQMKWSLNATAGTIDLEVDTEPQWARVNYAQTFNNSRREYRFAIAAPNCPTFVIDKDYCIIPATYKSRAIKGTRDGDKWRYSVEMDAPSEGYLAFYIELKFDRKNEDGTPNGLRLATEMNIIPDGYPYPQCEGEACRGTLV